MDDARRAFARALAGNALVTHRVRMAGVGEVDRALIAWLKQAYAAA